MSDGGGEPEQLAPVIPLFGRTAARDVPPESGTNKPDGSDPATTGTDAVWHSTWSSSGSSNAPKPASSLGSRDPSDRHPARGASSRTPPKLRALHSQTSDADGPTGPEPGRVREAAEELLVRKLRSRSLSISEARMVLKGYELEGERVDSGSIDDVIDDFCRRGYLDDALLAGQLVTAGVERKGQGRVALSRALAQRGIPRDVVDAALDELPDDDADRALEYARTKARGLSRLDGDTALRRLVGQLSRRGYNGSVAMTAAKTALAEASFGRPASGVRFVDSD